MRRSQVFVLGAVGCNIFFIYIYYIYIITVIRFMRITVKESKNMQYPYFLSLYSCPKTSIQSRKTYKISFLNIIIPVYKNLDRCLIQKHLIYYQKIIIY